MAPADVAVTASTTRLSSSLSCTVPLTSIYSRTDGVVAWQCSLEPAGPLSENIEVMGSHIGLGVNPAVLYVIADRLAQPEGAWHPFDVAGCRSLLYRAGHAEEPL